MILFEILKYTLPSLVVFLTAYYLLKQVFESQKAHDEGILKAELMKENAKILTPVRLQALERMVLFLERIAPSNLILRQNKAGFNAFQFQTRLIHSIRDEFEHNLSQQLYISSPAWEYIVQAKEEVVRLINTAASQLKSDSPASELGQKVIQAEKELKKPIIKQAIDKLKKEMQQTLG